MQLLWVASLFFALLIAIFAIQNTTPVSVWFFFWRIDLMPVAAMVLASAATGALLTYVFGLHRGIRRHLALRGSQSAIRDKEALIAQLEERIRELEEAQATVSASPPQSDGGLAGPMLPSGGLSSLPAPGPADGSAGEGRRLFPPQP
jgi:putative membrane protein